MSTTLTASSSASSSASSDIGAHGLIKSLMADVLFEYHVEKRGRLHLHAGSSVVILQTLETGWWDGICRGQRGWFPSNFVSAPYTRRVPPLKEFGWTERIVNADGSLTFINSLTGETLEQAAAVDSTASNAICPPSPVRSGGCEKPKSHPCDSSSISATIKSAQTTIKPGDLIATNSITYNEDQLPTNWGIKTTPEGRTYYYNMITNETTWSLEDIGHEEEDIMLQKLTLVDGSSTNKMTKLQEPESNCSTECKMHYDVGSWAAARQEILVGLQALKKCAKSADKSRYLSLTSATVQSIRQILERSDTLDSNSYAIKSHRMLRVHHRHIIQSLSKLVLSARQAAGVWPPPDANEKLRLDINEVLLAVRHFTMVAENAGVKLRGKCPQHSRGNIQHSLSAGDNGIASPSTAAAAAPSPPPSRRSKICSKSREIGDLVRLLDSSVQQSNGLLAELMGLLEIPTVNPSELIEKTKELVTEVGQFLALLEEINPNSIPREMLFSFEERKQILNQDVAGLVSATTSAADVLAPADCTEQISMSSSNVLNSLQQLLISSKILLQDKDEAEQKVLQQNLQALQRERGSAEFCVRPRRALSMGTASNKPPTPGINGPPGPAEASLTKPNISKRSVPFLVPPPPPIKIDTSSSPTLDRSSDLSTVDENSALEAFTSPLSPTDRRSIARSCNGVTDLSLIIGRNISTSAPGRRITAGFSPDVSKINKIFSSGGTGESYSDKCRTPTIDEAEWFLRQDFDPKDILLSMDGDIKGATLPVLVEKLTSHEFFDAIFNQAFLLTYRSFCDPDNLLKLLFARFSVQPPNGLSEEQLEVWNERKLKPVRLRVINFIKSLVDSLSPVIAEDRQIMDRLKHFTDSIIKEALPVASEQLMKQIEKRESNFNASTARTPTGPKLVAPGSSGGLFPILPRHWRRLKLLDLDTLELARQLTLIESRLYSQIRSPECLNKAWSDKRLSEAPNIKEMIRKTNQITGWVADSILAESDIKKRCAVMKHFIHVAEKCRMMNNFNTVMAILAALNSSPIHRLKRTKEMFTSRTRQVLEELKKLMAPGQNFNRYRTELRTIDPPCVPFLGLYLTDLTFIEDGNLNNVKAMPHLINFDKRMKNAEKIREIQQYQCVPYTLVEVAEIQRFLMNHIESEEPNADDLYERSLQLEPREREDEKIARLLFETGFL